MKVSLLKFINWANRKKKKMIIIAIVLVSILVLSLFFSWCVNPIIVDTVELKSKSLTTRAMNSSIADVVMNSVVYDDLINVITDEFGNVSMIQANSLQINNLSKDVAQTTEVKIEEYGRNGIKIPIGSFTGIPLFVGKGPAITLNIMPVGAVTCTFKSQFESAGINQTMHRIYLKINASIGVIMPLATRKFVSEQMVLISESIIVGQVPEVYLYSDSLDTLLNFVPY